LTGEETKARRCTGGPRAQGRRLAALVTSERRRLAAGLVVLGT
jgi:hypothetical protein